MADDKQKPKGKQPASQHPEHKSNANSTLFKRPQGFDELHTKHLEQQKVDTTDNLSPHKKDTKGLRQGILRLQLIDNRKQINIPIKQEISLGRPDPSTNSTPDVDFTALGGYKKGVSRHHARIKWEPDTPLKLYDLGSSNGTYLNGTRLEVNKEYPLHNGDVIQLGQLAMFVYYEIQAAEAVSPTRDEDKTDDTQNKS